MPRIEKSCISGPMPDPLLVRVYVNGVIFHQGCKEGLSPKGRRYAFVPVWAAIPDYHWDDDDGRPPIARLADLIRDPAKRWNRKKQSGDPGLEWISLSVGSAIEDALARDFDRIPGQKKAPIVDSEIVNSAEPLVDDPAEAMEEAELREKLMGAISSLDPLDQQALKAAYWTSSRGRNIAEVQEIMGCVKSTAHKRISRITKSLARTLDKHK
jgi:DNA-directed RNA polymerase specialized sigma24 family protein